MKSVLIIGMGKFGRHLATHMYALGNDVMIVDRNASVVDELADTVTDASVADCRSETVLASLGINNFDVCFVTVGENFESSLVITSLLKKLGAKCIVSKAKTDIQAHLLKEIGANEVVYPEQEIAEKLAIRFNSENIVDYIKLTKDYSIYEVPVPNAWINKSIIDLDVRNKYKLNIVAIKDGNEIVFPTPSYVFRADDVIVVVGKSEDVFKIAK